MDTVHEKFSPDLSIEMFGKKFDVPFFAAHGGRAEGVKLYVQKIKEELREIMIMTDCRNISEITRDKIRL